MTSRDPATASTGLHFEAVTNRPPRTLRAADIDTFNQRGYVAGMQVFDTAEADAQRARFDVLIQRVLAAGGDAYDINAWHVREPAIWDIVTEPRILDLVQDLIGPDIVCWGSHYFCKLPGDSREVPFHQDASYWPFRPFRTVTVWLAVDDVHADTGPMCFLPGSHLHGRRQWQRRDDAVVLALEISDRTDLAEPEPLLLPAGAVSLHSDLLVHGSAANRSGRRRCGLTLRYAPCEVWVKAGTASQWTANAVLCRGQDRSGRWSHNPRPPAPVEA